MQLQELLLELRRNPGQNQKIAGHKEAIQFLKSKGCTQENDNGYGVSMTTIPKLGVNPSSKYNTPVGIYFYTAAHYIDVKGHGGYLEFQDDAPYIQIFKFSPDKVLSIDSLSPDQYGDYIKLLYSNINSVATLLSASEEVVTRKLGEFLIEAPRESKVKTYGGYLWYVLWQLSRFHLKVKNRPQGQAQRSSIIWNSLFRLIGVDIIIDDGSEVIHENEPSQGVVINPRSIQHATTIENTRPMPPHEAEKVKISNTAKKIDTPDAAYAYIFLATAEFNNGPSEHIKFKAEGKDFAYEIAEKHWAGKKDLKKITVEYSQNYVPKQKKEKTGEKSYNVTITYKNNGSMLSQKKSGKFPGKSGDDALKAAMTDWNLSGWNVIHAEVN